MTVVQTANVTLPSSEFTRTSFCVKQRNGSIMLCMLRTLDRMLVRTAKLVRSESNGVSEDDLKMYIRGC